MKRTALNVVHKNLGAQLANSAGWEMAASYGDPLAEHQAVRNACGITDFSSMGPIDVKGPDVAEYLNNLTVNEVKDVPLGRVVYTTMVNEQGLIIDDTTVYKLANNHYMVVTSTAKHDGTLQWMKDHVAGYDVHLTDMSSGLVLICLQGPKSRAILQKVVDVDLTTLGYFYAMEGKVAGVPSIISRTGFTGELGYELYVPSILGVDVWDALIGAGRDEGIAPVGTRACAATLRLEKGYLGGADLSDVTPLELPIAWTVRLSKKSFIGKDALARLKRQGITRRLVGFEVVEGVVPAGAEIQRNGKVVGKVTSSGFGPTVKKNIALGLVPADISGAGESFTAAGSDGKQLSMTVVPLPFYDPEGRRVRA